MKRIFSVFLTLTLVLPLFPFSALIAADNASQTSSPARQSPSLAFDAQTAYQGRFTAANPDQNAAVPHVIVFDSYRVTYVEHPYSFNGQVIHSLNIKVPVSIDGVTVSAEAIADAPILMHNPWGGDSGQAAPDPKILDTANFNLKRRAMAKGWVVVEPGMRGVNHFDGTAGAEDYNHHGKLPWPIVDLKAAIRYLRYGDNASLIPGDKEKIFFTGSSSGGASSSMIGASGNTHEYDEYFAEIGAAEARDDVFAAVPCCPVMTRQYNDALAFWFPFGVELPEGAHPLNRELTDSYDQYLKSLNLRGTVNGVPDTPLDSHAVYMEYLLGYLREGAVKFLNHISRYGSNNAPGNPGVPVSGMDDTALLGRAAIDAYLASVRPADAYNREAAPRSWIKPVFDPADENVVIGAEFSFTDYMEYMSSYSMMALDPIAEYKPSTDVYRNTTPEGASVFDANGLNKQYPDAVSNPGRLFGGPADITAVFSDLGWDYLRGQFKLDVPEENKALIRFQRNSVDPMHFISGDEAVDIAPNWFLRNGGIDGPHRNMSMFNMATALMMRGGFNIDIAIAWDQGHAYTQDVAELFAWADTLTGSPAAPDKLAFNDAPAAEGGAYLGTFTVPGNAAVTGEIEFKSYQVTYVAKPYQSDVFPNATDVHKMNIKVPVSYNGVPFAPADLAEAPILMLNPWGGDNQAVPPATDTVADTNYNVKRRALARGWILAEPGMRGLNSYAGTVGQPDFYNYGKLPAPIVDLKAAIRYLRHGDNAELIPGNKERIFFTGSSSGGAASSMIGASGNTHEYDVYLEEIGAAMDARDDVFAAGPCCPIINRHWTDANDFWFPLGTDLPENAHPDNRRITEAYQAYQDSLGLNIVINGVAVPLSDHDAYVDIIWGYMKQSMVEFLNHISKYGTGNAPGAPGTRIEVDFSGLDSDFASTFPLRGKAAIDAYLASHKPAASAAGTGTALKNRDWIKPIYDSADPNLVIDVDNTVDDYWAYVTPSNFLISDPVAEAIPRNDKYKNPDLFDENGVHNDPEAPTSAVAQSVGRHTDYSAVFSDLGWAYLKEQYGIDVPQEYKDLIIFQRNATDPMHFLLGSERVDVAPHWFIRDGGNDTGTKFSAMFNIVAAVEAMGYEADFGFTWDQNHGYTNDVEDFFAWADAAMASPAPDGPVKAVFTADSSAYTVDGRRRYSDAAPLTQNGIVFLPLRAAAEALGAEVRWDEAARSAAVILNGQSMNIAIHSPAANGGESAVLIGGRLMAPSSYLAAILSCRIVWDSGARSANIFK